ncbi:MAG: hypothetical protein HPY85_15130 [Anaerolineae bacterium]|jgi:hypothetical protein|nr:hypothetical protein [Anaerolineae bacterium]
MDDKATYQIRVRQQLDEHWLRWFEGFTLQAQPDGDSLLTGHAIDQSALHSALNRIRDLGLELVSVQQLKNDQSENVE